MKMFLAGMVAGGAMVYWRAYVRAGAEWLAVWVRSKVSGK